MSITAKAGGALAIDAKPSATEETAVTANPRASMARARRRQKARSSSTISRVLSLPPTKPKIAGSIVACLGTPPRFSIGPFPFDCGHANALEPSRRSSPADEAERGTLPFEIAALPEHGHPGAFGGRLCIGRRDACTRTFQQRLGDEKAQSQTGILVGFRTAIGLSGEIGFAERRDNVGGEAWTVILDHYHRHGVAPSRATIRTSVAAKSMAFSTRLPSPYKTPGLRVHVGSGPTPSFTTAIWIPKSRCGCTTSSMR